MLISWFLTVGLSLDYIVIKKKLKNHYIRDGDHPFVILANFVFSAKKANWKQKEIEAIVLQAKANDYEGFVNFLKLYINN